MSALLISLYLLPGMVGYFSLSALTRMGKMDAFEKVSVTVCLAVVSTGLSILVSGPLELPTADLPTLDLVAFFESRLPVHLFKVSGFSLGISLVGAWFWNRGFLFRVLRKAGLTNRTGKTDVWHEAFTRARETWVQLVFEDDRQLVGWVRNYSETMESKGLLLRDAQWCFPGKSDWIKTPTTTVLVTDFNQVRAIEFKETGLEI